MLFGVWVIGFLYVSWAFIFIIFFMVVILVVRNLSCWNVIVCGKYLFYDEGIWFGFYFVI